MENILFWSLFLGLPLALVLVAVYVWHPSAREKYSKAEVIPLTDGDDGNYLKT